jgi:hypothetical protein
VTRLTRPSWAPFSSEFHCRGCGSDDAVRSRPRGFFEKHILTIFFLQPVRCDRCYLRSYISHHISVRERPQSERKQPESQPGTGRNANSRIA